MQRIVRGLSATLSYTFYSDGTATNPSPDATTVTITRDDGTAIVTGAAATEGATAGVVTYTLTPAQTATLDILTVAWTATFGGQAQTFTDIVEVAGGVLFTIAQARAVSPLNDTSTYTTARIVEARTMVETALEDACGVAFVPRYKRQFVSGNGRSTVILPPRTTAIRSVTLDGAVVSQGYVDTMRLLPTGEVYYPSWWSQGYANYEIAFEHGYDYPPPRVTHAALKLAKRYLVDSPVSDRATTLTTEDGTTQFLVTAGVRQAVFDIPEANAVVDQYSLNVTVA